MTTRLIPPDRIQLTQLLSTIFAERDAAARKTFLEQPGLHQFVAAINLSGDAQMVCSAVVNKLEEYGPLDFWPGYTALGALLWYINTLPAQPPPQRKLAARLIIKYALIEDGDYLNNLLNDHPDLQNAAPPTPPSQHADIRNALRAARQNRPQRANGRAHYEIDEDLILREFDLEVQTTAIHNRLAAAPTSGLLPFFLAGDPQILMKLLIPRVVDYLEGRLVRTVANRHQIPLNQTDLMQANPAQPNLSALLDQKLAQNYNIKLQTLVQQPEIDSLLAIINVDIPPDKASALAAQLLAETEKSIHKLLQQHGILFVMLWINPAAVTPAVEQFCCVSPLAKLPEPYVTRWFERKLQDAQVAQADITRCVQALRQKYQYHNGSPRAVYWDMQEIVQALKQGRGL